MISEKQKEKGWGKSVVVNLAQELQQEFPGMKGFSEANLWYMAQFYSQYQGNTKLESLIREIGWTHNLTILKKCKNTSERIFYVVRTVKFGWTTRVLLHMQNFNLKFQHSKLDLAFRLHHSITFSLDFYSEFLLLMLANFPTFGTVPPVHNVSSFAYAVSSVGKIAVADRYGGIVPHLLQQRPRPPVAGVFPIPGSP
jgi:predicted nuclease of restriction endonuclease-like (RecB) superfamily